MPTGLNPSRSLDLPYQGPGPISAPVRGPPLESLQPLPPGHLTQATLTGRPLRSQYWQLRSPYSQHTYPQSLPTRRGSRTPYIRAIRVRRIHSNCVLDGHDGCVRLLLPSRLPHFPMCSIPPLYAYLQSCTGVYGLSLLFPSPRIPTGAALFVSSRFREIRNCGGGVGCVGFTER